MKKETILGILEGQKIISSHSHHLPDKDHPALTLQGVLEHSYVGWCTPSIPDGSNPAEVEAWRSAVGCRSYFVSLEKALMELYDIPERLNARSWPLYDEAIRSAHRDSGHHLRVLRERCGYETILLDAFWNPGDRNGHPDLFRPAFRVNSFFFGHDPTSSDHNGNNAARLYGLDSRDMDAYLAGLDAELEKRRAAGSPVIKCALAYDRGLHFDKPNRDAASKAFGKDPVEQDVAAFHSYLFHHICERSAALNMPMQIHTGLGLMDESRAQGLQSVIAAHPDTRFLLMHGSYPWTADILGLAHAFPNVWADLCWLPLISTAAAYRFLHELIDVCNGDRIVWGCDTWTSEESFGARNTFLRLLSHVLAERIEGGLMDEEGALQLARGILHDNLATLL